MPKKWREISVILFYFLFQFSRKFQNIKLRKSSFSIILKYENFQEAIDPDPTSNPESRINNILKDASSIFEKKDGIYF